MRDLIGTVNREKAAIGVLISMQEPTQPMKTEAADAGFYHSPGWNTWYRKVQLLTVADLFAGKNIEYPHATGITFKQAQKVEEPIPETETLPGF